MPTKGRGKTGKTGKTGNPRGRPEEHTLKGTLAAIKGSRGIVTYVAKRMGVDWNTAKKYVTKWPEAIEAMAAERDTVTDIAESKLMTQINKSEQWAVKFWLTTIGRKRGFTEKTELVLPEGGIDINLRFVKPEEGE